MIKIAQIFRIGIYGLFKEGLQFLRRLFIFEMIKFKALLHMGPIFRQLNPGSYFINLGTAERLIKVQFRRMVAQKDKIGIYDLIRR